MPSKIVQVAAAVAAAFSATLSVAHAVTPPPLPPGSARVRPEAGLQEPERKRFARAHHNKFRHKQDYTHDDSVPAAPGKAGALATGAAVGGSAGATAGAAAGPAAGQAQTSAAGAGRASAGGASGYFFGNNKK